MTSQLVPSRWPRRMGRRGRRGPLTGGGRIYVLADATAVARGGAAAAQNMTNASSGTSAVDIHADGGAAATRFTPGTGGHIFKFNDRISFLTERPGGDLKAWNSCWEVRAVFRFDNPTGAVLGDTGVLIGVSTVGYMDTDGATSAAGVKFGPSLGPGALRLRARAINGGAYSVDELVLPSKTPDLTKYNTYALRVVSGLGEQDPYLVGLVNGNEVTDRYPWTAAAAVLPQPDAVSAANVGYLPMVGVRPGGAGIIPTASLLYWQIIAAETLAGLV